MSYQNSSICQGFAAVSKTDIFLRKKKKPHDKSSQEYEYLKNINLFFELLRVLLTSRSKFFFFTHFGRKFVDLTIQLNFHQIMFQCHQNNIVASENRFRKIKIRAQEIVFKKAISGLIIIIFINERHETSSNKLQILRYKEVYWKWYSNKVLTMWIS